jgi:PHD/YefM family antitoxin component YafN of YafNO toxin-antitoxin module
MNTIPAQEIKRRGISAVDEALVQGPVHIVRNNLPQYVIISEKDYESILCDLAEARLAASEKDLQAGRVRRGNVAKLLSELAKDA